MPVVTAFNDKSQIQSMYVDYMKSAYANCDSETGSPNCAEPFTTAEFEESVNMLAAPYMTAVGA